MPRDALGNALGSALFPVVDPVLTFGLMLATILLAPLVVRRLRIPGAIGLIVAGVLIGPNALGVLELSPIGTAPLAGTDAIRTTPMDLLGTVGLLYILFLAGLQLDLNQFRRYRRDSMTFGSVSYLLPQLIGVAVARWVLGLDWLAAVLLGSMFGSHTLLTYPIAARLGLVRQRAVTAGVGGTIVTDVSALLVLTAVVGLHAGSIDGWFLGGFTLKVALFIAAVAIGLPWLARWFLRTVPPESSTHFVFILTVVYLAAYAARLADLQPIIGAFLAGLALNRLVPRQSVLMNRLEFAGGWLLIPSFLVATGMRVDPAAFWAGAGTALVALVMVATVTVAKFLAAWGTGLGLGYGPNERWVLFSLSVNQAAATLAAVIVGYEVGIFTGPEILNGTIVMIMATCGFGTAAMERFGRRLALEQESAPDDAAAAPQRILIPLGNPRAAEAILDIAFLIRDEKSHEPLHPLTVVQDSIDASEQDARGERLLEFAVTHAVSADVPVVPQRRLDTNAASGILRAIRELRITTVVMGWTGSGAARNLIFGTVLDELLRQSPQQFVVCRLTAGLATLKRLVLLVPPFAQREPGFLDSIRTIKLLAAHGGLEVVVSARTPDLQRLEGLLSKVRPEATLRFEAIDSISAWAQAEGPGLSADDLVVLLAARRHQVSWQPMLDRLPQALVARAADTGLLVVYPSEERTELEAPEPESTFEESLDRILSPRRLHARVDATAPQALVARLLGSPAQRRGGSAELAWRALAEQVAASRPLALAEGTILLHGRAPLLRRAEATLATLAVPLAWPGVEGPVRIVVLLLEPTEAPASEHLRHLAAIAKALHEPSTLARLCEAETDAELAPLLEAG
jgi:Kef-type K+ transport system membrane component KefB/nucleotide-binding universal stress UspA family protein/mannitol/fructose-specific phosphotransferase system IIA component (Ntr-type)